MGGVVLPGRGERHQSSPDAGHGDERGIEDRHREDEHWNHPADGRRQLRKPQLDPEGAGHQAEQHGTAVTQKDARRLGVEAEKAE